MTQTLPSNPQTVPRNALVHGDCIEQMAGWAEDTIDLIFADPPYNIGYEYDHYKDKRDDADYLQWTFDWVDGCARLLKPTGSLYILIGDEYAAETRVHLKQLERAGQLVFRNWIVWHYTFGQRCKIKFNRSHAHLFYCVGSAALGRGGKPKIEAKDLPFTFNYDAVAVPSARMTTYNDKRQNASGKLPDDTWYLRRFPDTASWYTRPQEADDPQGGYFEPDLDTWYKARLCGTFRERQQWHPCQLPEALLERIVKTSSNKGDLVFDPFTGSGTTLAVANRLDRHWLGCELSEDYAAKALQRIEHPEVDVAQPVVTAAGKRAGQGRRNKVAEQVTESLFNG